MSSSEEQVGPRVFLGSTAIDLATDCRPNAIRAIRRGGGHEICMETWDASYRSPFDVCREMVQQKSSHYIGLFAYYRGYVQRELGISITQAEFEWARQSRGPDAMGVYVPNSGSSYAATLRRRARKQTPEDSEAQQRFLKAVGSYGVYLPFEDPADLEGKVTVRVLSWSRGGLLNLAAAEPRGKKLPTRDDLVTLGRPNALAIFDAFDAPAICFLISGPPGYGHEFLMERIRSHAKAQVGADLRVYRLAIGGLWREATVSCLLRTLGAEISPGEAPETIDEAVALLLRTLEKNSVFIEISGIHRLNGLLPEFVEQFWVPLQSRLGQRVQHRLSIIVTLEVNSIPERWRCWFQRPDVAHAAEHGFEARLPVELAKLDNHTQPELNVWLRRWLPLPDAEKLSKRLIEETGGVPPVLYNKLVWDPSTWT